MKNRIVRTVITMVAIAVLAGCSSMSVRGCNKTSTVVSSSLMAAVDGLDQIDNTEVYFTRSQEDYDAMTEVLEHRNGKTVVEVIEATVLDDEGNASDQFGFYVKYDSKRFSKGDQVKSVIVYNPDTYYVDDILYRSDSLIK